MKRRVKVTQLRRFGFFMPKYHVEVEVPTYANDGYANTLIGARFVARRIIRKSRKEEYRQRVVQEYEL